MVEITTYEVRRNFQCLKLVHQGEVDASKVVARKLEDQVLDIHELPEEEAFVDEALWPLEVQDSDALADREVAAVCQQQG